MFSKRASTILKEISNEAETITYFAIFKRSHVTLAHAIAFCAFVFARRTFPYFVNTTRGARETRATSDISPKAL